MGVEIGPDKTVDAAVRAGIISHPQADALLEFGARLDELSVQGVGLNYCSLSSWYCERAHREF